MPDYKDYIQNVYNALNTKVQGFNRTPQEFEKLIRSNTQYRQNVYNALSDKVQGFKRTTEEFDSLVGAESPIPKAAQAVKSLPTFQEQQRQLVDLDKNKFDKASERDNASWSAAFKTLYNGLVVGGVERTVGGLVELAPSPYGLPKELVRAQKAKAKEDISKVADIGKFEVTPQEQAALQFDVTKNTLGQNAKALVAMSGQMVGDIVIGAATGGASYVLQGINDGVNEYDEGAKRAGVMPNDTGRMAFGLVNGAVNGLLERFAINKIFGEGPALRNLQRKVVAEIFDETLKKGQKFTVKEVENLAENKIRNLAKEIRVKGVKALYGATVEGGTEGIQSGLTDIAKIITNKAEKREVFDDVDMKSISKNFVNNVAAGFIFGTPMGLASSLNTHVDNQLLKDVSKAKTEEDFNRISSELTSTFDKKNYSPEQREAIMNKMKDYAEVKQSIPDYTPSNVQERVIPKILQRRDIDKTISDKEATIGKLDESLKSDMDLEINMLKDRRNYLNDQIREDVSEDKFNYYEENGKYYKRLGENPPEEISKNYYEMSEVGNKQQADKVKPTDINLRPTIIVNGNEYTGADHGEAMQNAIAAGENVPDPSTQEGEIWREENGLFKDSAGKIFDRDVSEVEYGVRRSSQIQKTEPISDVLLPKIKDFTYDTPVLKSPSSNFEVLYMPKKVYELAYENDVANKNRTGGPQSLDTIIKRGGYTIEEFNKLLPNWKEIASVEIGKSTEKIEEPEANGYAASTMQKIRREEALKTIDEIGTPIDARQAAWLALAQGAKVGRESFIRETRLGQGEILKNKLLLKGGQTIEKASESIHENLPDEMQDIIYQPDIRNELIDLVQTYNTKEEARRAYIDFYSKRLTAIEDVEARMQGVDEVVLLDDIAYSKNKYDEFLKDVAELEEPIRVSDEYVNILIQENEQDAQREGKQVATEAEGKPAEPVISPISIEKTRKAVGEYASRFGTDEEVTDFDQYVSRETARADFDAEYRDNAIPGESREKYLLRKYCK